MAEKRKIFGYATFHHPEDYSGKRNLEIDFIYVPPKFRRKGIATQLLNFLMEKYKKVTWISLWTSIDSEKDESWRLYEKLGFKQLAYQEDYYKKGWGTRLFVKRMAK